MSYYLFFSRRFGLRSPVIRKKKKKKTEKRYLYRSMRRKKKTILFFFLGGGVFFNQGALFIYFYFFSTYLTQNPCFEKKLCYSSRKKQMLLLHKAEKLGPRQLKPQQFLAILPADSAAPVSTMPHVHPLFVYTITMVPSHKGGLLFLCFFHQANRGKASGQEAGGLRFAALAYGRGGSTLLSEKEMRSYRDWELLKDKQANENQGGYRRGGTRRRSPSERESVTAPLISVRLLLPVGYHISCIYRF